jgi:hypothetical protein
MSQLPEPLRRRMAELAERSATDRLVDLLRAHVADSTDMAEVGTDLRRLAAVNTRSLEWNLAAVETVLADPPQDGSLARLVALEGNWALHGTGDEGAIAFLRELADLLRTVLAEAGAPGTANPVPGGDQGHAESAKNSLNGD